MDKNTPVSAVMTANPICLDPNATMEQVEAVFEDQQINHLPICEKDQVVGMISRVDYLKLLHSFTAFDTAESREYNQAMLTRILVEEVMAKDVVSTHPGATVADVAAIFRENRFHALPVVGDQDGRIIGIVTVMDLLNFAFEQ